MHTNSKHRAVPVRLACWTAALMTLGLGTSNVFAQGSPACLRGHHARRFAVQVPAGDEITVFDPHVSSDGKPTPIVYSGVDGEKRVDIPPAVVVHNYFYTGDRDFRAPRLPGGPSIVVVNHPDTGERHYLDVQMLPGSPRIVYRRDSIDYDFGHRRIHIQFSNPCKCLASDVVCVSYLEGNPAFLDGQAAAGVPHGGHVVAWVNRTGLPHATRHVLRGTHTAIDSTADMIHTVGERVSAPVVRVIESTPLGSIVEPRIEERATNARDRAVERAQRIAERNDITIPTNR